jgi:hypothetical protein
MTPKAKEIAAVPLLAPLALPIAICSLVFIPMGVGWLICGLTIWPAVRLKRSAGATLSPEMA